METCDQLSWKTFPFHQTLLKTQQVIERKVQKRELSLKKYNTLQTSIKTKDKFHSRTFHIHQVSLFVTVYVFDSKQHQTQQNKTRKQKKEKQNKATGAVAQKIKQ